MAGADRLVIQFDTVVPTYELKPNDRGPGSTEFLGSASGLPLTVAGSFGLHLQLRGLVLPNNYPHGTDIHVTSAELKEARVVGDFEAITDIGIGLAVERCPKVTTLTGPPRLVIDFPTS